MAKPLVVELKGDAAEAIHQLSMITKRNPEEVVRDALTTYYWILYQQTFNKNIASLTEDLNDRTPIVDLVADKERAKAYFASEAAAVGR